MRPEPVLAALLGAEVFAVNPDGTYSVSERLVPTKSICTGCSGNGYIWREQNYAYTKCSACRGRGEVAMTAAVPKIPREEILAIADKIAERLP